MAENENPPQTELEGQGEAKPAEATAQPEAQETAPEAPKDDFSPRAGETLEAYAARVRGEVSWRDRQLTQQHKRIKDRDAKAIEIEQELQRVRDQSAVKTAPEQPKPPISQPQSRPAQPTIAPDAIAAARRQLLLEQTEAKLNNNPDWPAALRNLQKVQGIPEEVLRDILVTDDPAYVFLELGKDLNKFTQITEMSEDNRRAAIIKLGMEPGLKAQQPSKPEVKKPSEAPPPRTSLPAGGAAAPADGDIDLYDEKYASSDYDDAWYRKRLEQKTAAKNRPWSFGGRSGPGGPR